MMITLDKEAEITIGQAPDGDSIHIEIAQTRDTIESVYFHPSRYVKIEWLAGGFTLKIR